MANQTDKELILEEADRASRSLLYWNEMTLNKLTDINKHLIGIALILIPLVGALAIPHHHSVDLNINQKLEIRTILGVLFWAIIFGFIQIIDEYIIFKVYTYKNGKRAEVLYDNQSKSHKIAQEKGDQYRIKTGFAIITVLTFPYFLLIEAGFIIYALIQVSNLVNSFLGI